jgi:hypothetical protein
MHVPAKHERSTGTKNYAAHKMVRVSWATPQLHQRWLKHMIKYKLFKLRHANYFNLYDIIFITLWVTYNSTDGQLMPTSKSAETNSTEQSPF